MIFSENASEISEIVSALAQLAMALAVAAGVVVAQRQLSFIRSENRRKRRAELAEETIVLARQVEDAFKYMRNPFDRIPVEKIDNKEFVYKKRYERISESSDLFLRLREYQVRCDAVFGSGSIGTHVTELFNARSDIAIAIEELIDFAGKPTPTRDAEALTEATRTLYGSWSQKDKLGQNILREINAIVEKMAPHARF